MMFNHAKGPGFISLMNTTDRKPLTLWGKTMRGGRIKRLRDEELQCLVLEITGEKHNCNYVTCPADWKKGLGISFHFFNMTVLPLGTEFSFDVQILDDKNVRRRFRIATNQSYVDVRPLCVKVPLILEEGWNQVTLPLHKHTKEVFGTHYKEALRVQIYSCCRLKRCYFSDKDYPDEELPVDYRIYGKQPKAVKRTLETVPEAGADENGKGDASGEDENDDDDEDDDEDNEDNSCDSSVEEFMANTEEKKEEDKAKGEEKAKEKQKKVAEKRKRKEKSETKKIETGEKNEAKEMQIEMEKEGSKEETFMFLC